MRFAPTILVAILAACAGPDYPYYFGGPDITHYEVEPDAMTSGGLSIDTSGYHVDLDRLDGLTADFERCAGLSVRRSDIVVKIAPDWYVSSCSGTQLFPCDLPDWYIRQLEEHTGRQATEECPWACAGAVQPPNVIVVPPSLAAYKHELVHLVLYLDNHDDPEFRCQ